MKPISIHFVIIKARNYFAKEKGETIFRFLMLRSEYYSYSVIRYIIKSKIALRIFLQTFIYHLTRRRNLF